jgi:site-specific recombinase XerD
MLHVYKLENTKRAYRADWKQFISWCEKNHLEPLPDAPETIVYFITYLGKDLTKKTRY